VRESASLNDLALAAYECALRHGGFSEETVSEDLGIDVPQAAECRARLEEMHLLVSMVPSLPAIPIDPQVAEAELTAPLEESIRRKRKNISSIHQDLRKALQIYQSGSFGHVHGAAIRVLDNPAEIEGELLRARRHCTREVMVMQPGGGRSADSLHEVTDHVLDMLRRGIRWRILYQHTARASLATRSYTHKVLSEGGEVRTSNEFAERLFLYDRAVAFVPKAREKGVPPGAALVTDPTVVGFLCRTFESAWQSATPFEEGEGRAAPHGASDVQLAVMRLMAAGLKDEVVARRLGMSTRTCRRHIATLMEELGATSRFQAGLEIGRQGLVPHTAAGEDYDAGDFEAS
jgi:DNA-binding CsgD family transcriptional regulator